MTDALSGLASTLTASSNLTDYLFDDLAAFMSGAGGALGRRLLAAASAPDSDGSTTDKVRAGATLALLRVALTVSPTAC